jgi:hypothetical protein
MFTVSEPLPRIWYSIPALFAGREIPVPAVMKVTGVPGPENVQTGGLPVGFGSVVG